MPADPFTYVYKSVGHCDIKADVYRPSSASSPAPVIVVIHGGGHGFDGRADDPKVKEAFDAVLAFLP